MVSGMPEARGRRKREGRKGCERLSLWEGKERETMDGVGRKRNWGLGRKAVVCVLRRIKYDCQMPQSSSGHCPTGHLPLHSAPPWLASKIYLFRGFPNMRQG